MGSKLLKGGLYTRLYMGNIIRIMKGHTQHLDHSSYYRKGPILLGTSIRYMVSGSGWRYFSLRVYGSGLVLTVSFPRQSSLRSLAMYE